MDIDILLALQEFRNGSGAFLASFFSKMTWLGELNTAIVIMALIYWCISKDIPRALRVVLAGTLVMYLTMKLMQWIKNILKRIFSWSVSELGSQSLWQYTPRSSPILQTQMRLEKCWWKVQRWQMIPLRASVGALHF